MRHRFVAAHRGIIIGYTGYDQCRQTLTECYVHPGFQGWGTGRRLVELVIGLAELDGLDRLTVLASANALGFYERLGFIFDQPEGLLMANGLTLPCGRMHIPIRRPATRDRGL
jgi:GNAT superfamily N-acetyltransferase